ncbi:MAG TPA: hypothetical protein VNO52_14800 [Methylomirabilota bacterium]|nr:hypothetical protein [Methylomirabilota bacterium]
MNPDLSTDRSPEQRRSYRWPWFLAAALVLGLVICIFAIAREAARIKRMKASTSEVQATNAAPARPPSASR